MTRRLSSSGMTELSSAPDLRHSFTAPISYSRLPLRATGYEYEIIEVNDCLRSGALESSVMPLDDSLRVMRLVDRLRRQLG